MSYQNLNFLEKISIKEINKSTRNPIAQFYSYENLRNNRQENMNIILKMNTHFILEKQVHKLWGIKRVQL
jgi:hypothetical protein